MKQNPPPESMHHRVRAKMDGLTVRTPWNPVLQSILEKIFGATESEIYFKMPYGLSDIDRLGRLLKLESIALKQHLDAIFADAGNIMFSCILKNGNILFATRTKLYLSTDQLKSFRPVTVQDRDGNDYL